MHPFSFATGYAEKEAFHLGQMIKQKDTQQFLATIDKEISAHNNVNHWQVVQKSEVTQSIIKATWKFKRKRDPTGIITTHKARL